MTNQEESWRELIQALERAKMYAQAACEDLCGEWSDSKLLEEIREHAGEAANQLSNALYAARAEVQRLKMRGELEVHL